MLAAMRRSAGGIVYRPSCVRSTCAPARARSQFTSYAITTARTPQATQLQNRTLFSVMGASPRLPAFEDDDVEGEKRDAEGSEEHDVAEVDHATGHALEPGLERDQAEGLPHGIADLEQHFLAADEDEAAADKQR